MSVSSFATQSASSLSDEGGVVVKATNKNSAASHLPLDSSLVAGTYLLKITGSGPLSVYSYTGTTMGGRLVTINSDVARSTMITIPSGITGLYLTGTYSGPIIFQTVSTSSTAVIASRTYSEKSRKSEYTSTPRNLRFIPGTNTAIRLSYVGSPYIQLVDMATNTVLASPASAGFDYRDIAYWSNIARNGNNLVFTAGYAQGSTIRVYRSSDLGYTWSYSEPSVYTYAYAPQVSFAGNRFFIFMAGDGYGNSGTSGHISSADNGASWTSNTSLFSYGYGGVGYVNGTYVLFNTQLYYGSYTPYNSYYTSTDGISWTNRTSPNNPYGNYGSGTTSHNPKAVISANNKIYLFAHDYNNQYPVIFTSTDGIAWSIIANGNAVSMQDWQATRTAYYGEIGASSMPYAVTSAGIWWVTSPGHAEGYIGFLRFSNDTISAPHYYTKNVGPLSGTNEYIRGLMLWDNKITAHAYTQTAAVNVLFYLDGITNTSTSWNNVITKVSGMPSYLPNARIFLSKKFNRYYYVSSDYYVYMSDIGAASNWTKIPTFTINASYAYNDLMFETTNYMGIFDFNGYLWRSKNGTTWESVPVSSNLGITQVGTAVAAVRGETIVTRTNNVTGDYVVVSTDEGQTWNTVCLNQIAGTTVGTGPSFSVMATSGGFMAAQDSNPVFYFSRNGIEWTRATASTSFAGSAGMANDCAFFMNTDNPRYYTKTAVGGVMATSKLYGPFGNSYTFVVNALGSGFVAVPLGNATSYVYTSPDGVTWTYYGLPAGGVWNGMSGSSTGDSTLLWDATNKMFLELQETATLTLS